MSDFTHEDMLQARVSSTLEQLQAWLLDKAGGLVTDEEMTRPVIMRLHLFGDIDLNADTYNDVCHVCRGGGEMTQAEAWVFTPNPALAIVAEAVVCNSCKQYLKEKGPQL